jgi:hypothetical protein
MGLRDVCLRSLSNKARTLSTFVLVKQVNSVPEGRVFTEYVGAPEDVNWEVLLLLYCELLLSLAEGRQDSAERGTKFSLQTLRQHTSAYVSIRQHTSAYVSIRQHTSACVCIRQHASACVNASASSAYVSICQHTSACVSMRQHTSAYVSIRQHTSAYVSIRQHTSAYVPEVEGSRQMFVKYGVEGLHCHIHLHSSMRTHT